MPKILIADDDLGVLSALKMLIISEGFEAETVLTPSAVLDHVRTEQIQLVLMDLNYSMDTTSGSEGLALIKDIRQIDESLPIIVMTGWGTIDIAVSSLKNGASDFIQKPWDNERLLSIIHTQLALNDAKLANQRLAQHNQLLKQEYDDKDSFIAEDETSQKLLKLITHVAKSDANILLTGENGTGKSMYARYIHQQASHRKGEFISVNMGAVTETLFESEMFGHMKGAFTDAKQNRLGRFELADKGTLFLDEIANTPYSQQAKLLRVLEDRQFEKVGSSKTQTTDIRLITATNADLTEAVENGAFRKDLYYRLNTVEIEIPPLRQRKKDVLCLAESFLKKIARKYGQDAKRLSNSSKQLLTEYDWPGNVRELQHVMERAHILTLEDEISPDSLALKTDNITAPPITTSVHDLRPLEDIESDIIKQRFEYFDKDAVKAADSLGLSRSAFYRRLSR